MKNMPKRLNSFCLQTTEKSGIWPSTPTLKYEKSIATIPVWDFVWELIFAIFWLGKNKYFPSPILRYRNFKIWHPLKETKSKNGRHFIISTFENLQLCFFVQKDSSTLKVLKINLSLAEPMIRNIAYSNAVCCAQKVKLSWQSYNLVGQITK